MLNNSIQKLTTTQLILAGALFLVGFLFLLQSTKHLVHAQVCSVLPCSQDQDSAGDHYEEIAYQGTEVFLQAPQSNYEVYTTGITKNNSGDSGVYFRVQVSPYSLPNNIDYIFTPLGSNGQPSTNPSCPISTGPLSSSNLTITYFVVPGCADSDGNGIYSVGLAFTFATEPDTAGQIFAFKLTGEDSSADSSGYSPTVTSSLFYNANANSVAGGLPFAEQAHGADASKYSEDCNEDNDSNCISNFNIPFTGSCSIPTNGQPATLSWTDADGYPSTTPENWRINFSVTNQSASGVTMPFYQDSAETVPYTYVNNNTPSPPTGGSVGTLSAGGSQNVVSSSSIPDIGQQSTNVTAYFTILPGDNYYWTWRQVLNDNGVEFYIPTNAVNPQGSCPPPVSPDKPPTITATCDPSDGIIYGTATDPDGSPVTVYGQTADNSTGHTFVGMAAAGDQGYWEVNSAGNIYSYGTAEAYGDLLDTSSQLVSALGEKIVAIIPTPDAQGYWEVSNYGRVWAFGDAPNNSNPGVGTLVVPGTDGSQPTWSGHPEPFITGMAINPKNADNFWLIGTDGSVFPFGFSAGNGNYGSASQVSPQPSDIVGIAATSNGKGYWEVGSDGTMYGYGDATVASGKPILISGEKIVGIVAATDTTNKSSSYTNDTQYWLVANTGAMYAEGGAPYYGSPYQNNSKPTIVGMADSPNAGGYWEIGSDGSVYVNNTDGGIYTAGNATFEGNATPIPLNGYLPGPVSPGSASAGSNLSVATLDSDLGRDVYNTSGTFNFAFNVLPYLSIGKTIRFDIRALDVTGSSNGSLSGEQFDTNGNQWVSGDGPDVSCGESGIGSASYTCNTEINPADPAAGQSFSAVMTATVTVVNGYNGPIGGSFSLSLPNNLDFSATISDGAPLTATDPNLVEDTAGSYYVSAAFTSDTGQVVPCPNGVGPGGGGHPIVVTYKPYMKVVGGDVAIGSEFDSSNNSCSNSNLDGVIGWNHDGGSSGNDFSGAGSPFAVYAIGPIDGFASGKSTATNSGSGLSFGNVSNNNPTNDEFGGSFGSGSVPCATDYYADPSNSTSDQTFSGGSLSSLSSGNYITSGPVTITTSNIQSGSSAHDTTGVNATIYVDGNVYVDGNITYDGATGSGGWQAFTDIPQIKVVACGNIYIDQNVTELDGVYVAEPYNSGTGQTSCPSTDTTGGTIDTCSSDSNGSVPASWYTDCSNQLVVNGAFVAGSVKYQRSYGNLYPNATLPDGTAIPNKPAELFNYSPELWLSGASMPGGNPGGPPVTLQCQTELNQPCYDSITSLPPIL